MKYSAFTCKTYDNANFSLDKEKVSVFTLEVILYLE